MEANEFKRLYLPHSRLLYGIALRVTGSPPDAEDLVQETYLRLWRMRGTTGIPDNPAAYCVAVLRHVCADALRSRHPSSGTIPDMADDSDNVESDDSMARLLGMMQRLPDPQRRVMAMRDIDGMEFGEIAEATGLKQSHIRVLLFRARKQMREMINKYLKP